MRAIDFSQDDAIVNTLGQLGGGALLPDDILYADLTGDRREEAVVPISSQGTLGNIAYLVFMMVDGEPMPVLRRTLDRGSTAAGLVVAVSDGTLIETAGEFGPEDPFCCPSFLRRTYFLWDGITLQVEREERLANPIQPKR